LDVIDLGNGGFGPLTDSFVAEVTANLSIAEPGTYAFRLTSDDGSLFFLDGALVASNDGLHSATAVGADMALEMGIHPLRVLMFEASGDELLRLEIKGPKDADFRPVGGAELSPPVKLLPVGQPETAAGPKTFRLPTILPAGGPAQRSRSGGVLVFSKTAGFRHDSIPDGIAMVRKLGLRDNYQVVSSEDAGIFTDAGLAPFKAVIFLSTTGDILNASQEAAFERFIRAGNGFVGIHAASDTEYEWEFYGQLVGAYFKTHPPVQPANMQVVEPRDRSTRHLPAIWRRTDEWYEFRAQPPERVQTLLLLDETSYKGGGMGPKHPIAWKQEYAGGRAFYTAGGHTRESFVEPEFVEHCRQAILWAMNVPEVGP
jgi:type 1 glutamine amidotransferase